MNIETIKQKLLILYTCLESIDLYTLDRFHSIKLDKSTNIIKKNLVKSSLNYNNKNILQIFNNICKITRQKHNQEIIFSILTDYLHNYNNDYLQKFTKIYLNRFTYKYKKRNNQYTIKSDNKNTDIKLHQIAITNLYLLYKTSLNKGSYIILKYIYYIS